MNTVLAEPKTPAGAFIKGVGLAKTYGAVKALAPTDFALLPGEVVGLIGHNGAGKSTLINLLTGVVQRSSGGLVLHGTDVTSWSAAHARTAGLRCVFQELSLCPNLSVVENARVAHRSLSGFGWKDRAEKTIRRALDEVFPGHGIPFDRPVAELPIGQRQMVEIARAFSVTDSPVHAVILDEPTSSLGPEATAQLLGHITRASAQGIAVALVTHRLNEILATAHRVVVMKDGAVSADFANRGLTRGDLVAAMGSVETASHRAAPPPTGAPVLARGGITLRPGEILGLAGLDGHGQRDCLRAIHDAAPGQLAYVAGDRVVEGVFPLWSIRDNLVVRSLSALSRAGVISTQQADTVAQTWFDRLKVRAPSPGVALTSLSGGNQQKVLFARALASDAKVILLDDPMRGVDVGTKQEVYALIRDEAAKGRAFLWYSTEIEELENCHRVMVFREGQARVTLEGDQIDHNAIIQASFGGGHA